MSEGWTSTEAARAEKWCDGKGRDKGAPVCPGRGTIRTSSGRRLCQKCALGKPTPAKCPECGFNPGTGAECATCETTAQGGTVDT